MECVLTREDPAARKLMAWGVHGYTGLGLPLAFFSMIALIQASQGDARGAALFFVFNGVAMFVDATDGAMARMVRVKEVLPGKEEIFEGACKKVLEVMGEASGHDESQIFRRVDGGDTAQYLIVSRWNDSTAFDTFIASDAFKKVTSWGKDNILAGRPSHTTYQEG